MRKMYFRSLGRVWLSAQGMLRIVGESGFHYIALERALLVEQARRHRAKAARAVVAAGASSQLMMRSALFSVL